VRQRVIEGGHDVPVEDIKRRFARSIQHLLDDSATNLLLIPLRKI
jgi:predicted ABC-type ATPase